jgi:peptide/nickel transport system substrate-binding protein
MTGHVRSAVATALSATECKFMKKKSLTEHYYTGYCSPELVDQQSMVPGTAKRKQLVFEIERRLGEDAARPIIFDPRSVACWQPQFKGHTMVINGNYNNWRLEDAWLHN